MDITISHVLQLAVFNEARVITGEVGLENIISDVSVLEMPIIENADFDDFIPNEFYLTGLFAYKDNLEDLPQFFDQLILEHCSGLCIFDVYINSLPEVIIDKCKDNGLVVIFLSGDIAYSSVLRDIFQEIIRVKDEEYIESTLESILIADLDPAEVKRKAMFLNKDFCDFHMSIFVNEINEHPKHVVQMMKAQPWFNPNIYCSKFRNGIVIIVTFKELTVESHHKLRNDIVSFIKSSIKRYDVGISSLGKNIAKLNLTLSEAVVANSACINISKQVVMYENLGVYKLLYQLKSDVRLSRFRDDVLNPIKEYERENQVPLIETAIEFIDNDGDIKKTAEALFLHENTIRYRIEKIKGILNLEYTRFKYYEELSLAIKADKILKKLG